MKVTIIKGKCGFLHIFHGYNITLDVNMNRKNRYMYDDGKVCYCIDAGSEADLFIQGSVDVDIIEMGMGRHKLNLLNNGFKVNYKMDSLYFEQL